MVGAIWVSLNRLAMQYYEFMYIRLFMPSKQFECLMVLEIERVDALFNDPSTNKRCRVEYPEIEFPRLAIVASRAVALRREILAWLIARTVMSNSSLSQSQERMSVLVVANHNPAVLLRQLLALVGKIEFSTVDQVAFEDDDWPRLTSAVNLLEGHEGIADEVIDGEPPFFPDSEARLKWRNGPIGLGELLKLINTQVAGTSVVVENYHLITDTRNHAEALRDLRNIAAEAGVYLYIGGGMTHWHEVRERRTVYLSDLAESLSEAVNVADLITIAYPDFSGDQVCVFDPRYSAPHKEPLSLPSVWS